MHINPKKVKGYLVIFGGIGSLAIPAVLQRRELRVTAIFLRGLLKKPLPHA